MSKTLAHELRVVRNKSGLSEEDTAHLMSIKPSRLKQFESGAVVPSIRQLCKLALVYGRSFEGLFSADLEAAAKSIKQQLETIQPKLRLRVLSNRRYALRALARRLESLNGELDGRV